MGWREIGDDEVPVIWHGTKRVYMPSITKCWIIPGGGRKGGQNAVREAVQWCRVASAESEGPVAMAKLTDWSRSAGRTVELTGCS